MKLLVAIAVVIVALIAMAIMLPCTMRARPESYEVSATATLRTLVAAERNYAQIHKHYTDNLGKLGDLVDPVLAGTAPGGTPTAFTKNGYAFQYVPAGKSFHITADPIERGKSGQRSFYVDDSAVIRANATVPATVNDNPI